MIEPIKIVHLYPKEMNIYGDTGNRIVIEKRLSWRGIPFKSYLVGVGQNVPEDADFVIGGGGQDAAQGGIEKDLLNKASTLKKLADSGVVMLMICGMYQLFGKKFVTNEGKSIKGLGILDVETIAGEGRIIGNIVSTVPEMGEIVGYENHSGRTHLGDDAQPFARVISGIGNEEAGELEGARYKNVFGSYMHGPILSKNPHFADGLIKLALERRGIEISLKKLDDSITEKAHQLAKLRPR
ncbi:glutamine amidotransferase [Candidatus Saccharibacteria bacterium]|nr:glutamine amidotransferase [Candidatus Saccharibacteria bacterium]